MEKLIKCLVILSFQFVLSACGALATEMELSQSETTPPQLASPNPDTTPTAPNPEEATEPNPPEPGAAVPSIESNEPEPGAAHLAPQPPQIEFEDEEKMITVEGSPILIDTACVDGSVVSLYQENLSGTEVSLFSNPMELKCENSHLQFEIPVSTFGTYTFFMTQTFSGVTSEAQRFTVEITDKEVPESNEDEVVEEDEDNNSAIENGTDDSDQKKKKKKSKHRSKNKKDKHKDRENDKHEKKDHDNDRDHKDSEDRDKDHKSK